MKPTSMSVVLIVSCLTTPFAATQPIEREGIAASARCVACHGLAGIADNPTFPHLAGQNAAYLELQLERFRSGQRYDPLMTPIAQSLTDEEVPALSRYFESLLGFRSAPASASGLTTESTARAASP